jgi:adenine-specific DNA-methyltransferase
MKLNIKKVRDFINPLLSKKSIDSNKFDLFKRHLNTLKLLNQGESEEHQKNAVRDFLVNSFGYTVNTKGRIDLAIFKNHIVEVIIEAKSLANKTEMITKDELNRKAFTEAIKYFMDERKSGNHNVRHIMILTAFEWFVFDAKDFERLFWQDKDFKKIYKDYTNPDSLLSKTGDVYNEFSALIPKKKSTTNLFEDLEIDCAYFNLKENHTEKNLIVIYKLLSSDCLLKEFNPNDANSLNREFYTELLYILGLEEVKEGGKKLIGRAKSPQSGSFYENIAQKLETYSKPCEFEDIIKLIIIWINRILFLKLLESQITTWNRDPKLKFLNIQKIGDYDKLEMLFFEILAKRPTQRIHKEFDYIPYLNSSLFEVHADEQSYLKISNLSDDAVMEYSSKTVIRDEHRAKKSGNVSTLAYLFEFLDAYDFGSISDDEVSTAHNKTLISASVLGLIFEKINGYKDGSFYTPSFITMYMCRESLHASVIERFNRTFEIDAQNFEELRRYCDKHSYKEEFQTQANTLINTITICDPAVGSGHFLVSALNELIFIKYQLGLFHLRGLRLDLANDELLIMLEDEWFEYTCPKDFQSANHLLQKMLFIEKQQIIENQLFGVDINPNSTQITKLRLWIELLKNSYYDEHYQLVTLPNIDINIKTGNSLVSRFGLNDELKIKNIAIEIENYKRRVSDYKNNLGTKKEILESIQNIKDSFRLTLKAESKIITERNKILREYVSRYRYTNLNKDLTFTAIENNYGFTGTLFDDDVSDTKERKKLFSVLMKYQGEVDEREQGKIYEDAFEWRFEFPEVLDDEGNFVGFDIVIGNPPYFNIDTYGAGSPMLRYLPQNYSQVYMDKSDILFYFIAKAIEISKGQIGYIISNAMLAADKAKKLRNHILDNAPIEKIINFEKYQVFDEANITAMMIFMDKNHSANAKVQNFKDSIYDKSVLLEQISKDSEYIDVAFKEDDIFALVDDATATINEKIDGKYPKLGELFHAGSGMQTAANDVFGFETYPVQFEATYIKSRMSGEIIEKYRHKAPLEYLLYVENVKNVDDLPQNIRDYLSESENKKKLESRAEIKRNKNREWWKYTFPMHKEFYHLPKIWCSYRAKENIFCLDESTDFIGLTNTTAIFGNNPNIDLKYLLALLNSKLLNFRYKSIGKQTGSGVYEYFENQISRLPIPEIDVKHQQTFIELIDQILLLKKADPKTNTTALEKQIDEMVYKLYNLTDEEIAIVEGKQ